MFKQIRNPARVFRFVLAQIDGVSRKCMFEKISYYNSFDAYIWATEGWLSLIDFCYEHLFVDSMGEETIKLKR